MGKEAGRRNSPWGLLSLPHYRSLRLVWPGNLPQSKAITGLDSPGPRLPEKAIHSVNLLNLLRDMASQVLVREPPQPDPSLMVYVSRSRALRELGTQLLPSGLGDFQGGPKAPQ